MTEAGGIESAHLQANRAAERGAGAQILAWGKSANGREDAPLPHIVFHGASQKGRDHALRSVGRSLLTLQLCSCV